jgi:hypothetical protein
VVANFILDEETHEERSTYNSESIGKEVFTDDVFSVVETFTENWGESGNENGVGAESDYTGKRIDDCEVECEKSFPTWFLLERRRRGLLCLLRIFIVWLLFIDLFHIFGILSYMVVSNHTSNYN